LDAAVVDNYIFYWPIFEDYQLSIIASYIIARLASLAKEVFPDVQRLGVGDRNRSRGNTCRNFLSFVGSKRTRTVTVSWPIDGQKVHFPFYRFLSTCHLSISNVSSGGRQNTFWPSLSVLRI
jgi:hypothetical protein